MGCEMGPLALGAAEHYAASLCQNRPGTYHTTQVPGMGPNIQFQMASVGQASVPSENLPKGFQCAVTFGNPG